MKRARMLGAWIAAATAASLSSGCSGDDTIVPRDGADAAVVDATAGMDEVEASADGSDARAEDAGSDARPTTSSCEAYFDALIAKKLACSGMTLTAKRVADLRALMLDLCDRATAAPGSSLTPAFLGGCTASLPPLGCEYVMQDDAGRRHPFAFPDSNVTPPIQGPDHREQFYPLRPLRWFVRNRGFQSARRLPVQEPLVRRNRARNKPRHPRRWKRDLRAGRFAVSVLAERLRFRQRHPASKRPRRRRLRGLHQRPDLQRRHVHRSNARELQARPRHRLRLRDGLRHSALRPAERSASKTAAAIGRPHGYGRGDLAGPDISAIFIRVKRGRKFRSDGAVGRTHQRGGARPGAGRPRKEGRARRVSHLARPSHARSYPVHVTLRRTRLAPGFRRESVAQQLEACVAAVKRSDMASRFRVLQYSFQEDHVHLVVEAQDRNTLARGIQGLAIRLARGFNRITRRSGKVWGDRYHARPLTSPREVRRGIVYVLMNHKKHATARGALDPFSSALWFDGFDRETTRALGQLRTRDSPVSHPRTWLAAVGWRRQGLVLATERPASGRA